MSSPHSKAMCYLSSNFPASSTSQGFQTLENHHDLGEGFDQRDYANDHVQQSQLWAN